MGGDGLTIGSRCTIKRLLNRLGGNVRDPEATEVFKALSVPSRMGIFMLLKREGPLPVKEIAEALSMTAPAVSQHLKILRTVGLVNAKRQGYWIPYEVDPSALSDCCGKLVKICACPSCGKREEAEPTSEIDVLLSRREELLAELQRVESKLESLR